MIRINGRWNRHTLTLTLTLTAKVLEFGWIVDGEGHAKRDTASLLKLGGKGGTRHTPYPPWGGSVCHMALREDSASVGQRCQTAATGGKQMAGSHLLVGSAATAQY